MAVSMFIDYPVLDHLLRIQDGTYKSKFREELCAFQEYCSTKRANVWLADITEVEMILGRENPKIDDQKRSQIEKKDERKVEIGRLLGAKRLGYPCSKLGDAYSRTNRSMRTASVNWNSASALEEKLLTIKGVSPGDARQLTTACFGHNYSSPAHQVLMDCFITEDLALRVGVNNAVEKGGLRELRGMAIVSVAEFMSAQHMP